MTLRRALLSERVNWDSGVVFYPDLERQFLADLRKHEKPPAPANVRESDAPGALIHRPDTQSVSDNPLNWS